MKSPLHALSLAPCLGALLVASCSGGDPPQAPAPPCVENLNVDCTDVFYEPTYTNIYTKTLELQCTLGSNCHSAAGAMGGLVLATADGAYDALLGLKGGTKRVVPYDPTCSPLMVRLESRDNNFVMPQGMRLSEFALCDFMQWIKNGAQKN
jgi:hypothetical protein